MKRARTAGSVRVFGRLFLGLFALFIFTLVSIQFARIVNENIAMAHSLASVDRDIGRLRARQSSEERDIRRLLDPEGAVPEIHDRLHLVRPDEAIIYIRPAHVSNQ